MSDKSVIDELEEGIGTADSLTGLAEFVVYGVVIFFVVGIVLQAARDIPGVNLDVSSAVTDALTVLWDVFVTLGKQASEGITGWDV